jgi:hypothetical protein
MQTKKIPTQLHLAELVEESAAKAKAPQKLERPKEMPNWAAGQNLTRVPIRDYPAYEVDVFGNVYSRWSRTGRKGRGTTMVLGEHWKKLIPVNVKGYLQVYLSMGNGTHIRRRVHQLVLDAFVGPCPIGFEACHADGVRRNNALSNLRWDTPENNWLDRKRHGRGVSARKLTDDQIARIKSAVRYHGWMTALANQFGVSLPAIAYHR